MPGLSGFGPGLLAPLVYLAAGPVEWLSLWLMPLSASPAGYVSFCPCDPAPAHQTPGDLLATCSRGKMGKKGMGLLPCDGLGLWVVVRREVAGGPDRAFAGRSWGGVGQMEHGPRAQRVGRSSQDR